MGAPSPLHSISAPFRCTGPRGRASVRPARLLISFAYGQYAPVAGSVTAVGPGVVDGPGDVVDGPGADDCGRAVLLDVWTPWPPPQPDESAPVRSAAQEIALTRLPKSKQV